MEDVLEWYAEPYDPARPPVGFDEASKELHGQVAEPLPAQPGRPACEDSEDTRQGTAHLFIAVEPLAGRREVTVTARRTAADCAEQRRRLCDAWYPEADVIRVVLDTWNIHGPASLCAHFAPEEAWRLLRRLEFHSIPQHASGLNVSALELSVLARHCLDRRLAGREQLAAAVEAWKAERNQHRVQIEWCFRVADARRKLAHLYPQNPLR